jgi:DNA-directed RNA polymerase specialized sigma24 family protein
MEKKERTQEEKEILERIHYTIEKRYREVVRHVDIEIMKGSESVLGMTPEDLVNEAVLKFLSYIDDKLHEAKLYANFDACIAIILKQNSKNIFIDKLRQHDTTKKYGDLVKKSLYDEDDVSVSLQEFEKVEIRDLSDKLND